MFFSTHTLKSSHLGRMETQHVKNLSHLHAAATFFFSGFVSSLFIPPTLQFLPAHRDIGAHSHFHPSKNTRIQLSGRSRITYAEPAIVINQY